MYTALGVTKTRHDGKVILKNINLCFYPGAKIGVLGLNESGKSALLKIMAGEDVGGFDGIAVPMSGISIGYLCQEPTLEGKTIMDNINLGVKKGQDYIDRYTELSTKLSENLDQDERDRVMAELADVESKIDSGNFRELESVKTRIMDALKCPPPDKNLDVLQAGERKRVALARLLIENHNLLLLDMPNNRLDEESVSWLRKYLLEFEGSVVAVTDDHYFIENCCPWILELQVIKDRYFGEADFSQWRMLFNPSYSSPEGPKSLIEEKCFKNEGRLILDLAK